MDVKSKKIPKTAGFGIRHLQIVMMTFCATIIYVIRSSMGVAILAMTDTSQINNTNIEIYEWSEEIRGVILSSFFWGYTLMQIPAGILSKMFGGKPLLLMTLLTNSVLCLLTPALAKIGGWVAVCAIRAIMGLTQACFMPASHTLLGQWAPPQERSRLSLIAYAGIQMGTVLTMPVCGILSQTALGWKLIFYTMGFLSLFVSVFWWAFTGSSPREHRFMGIREREYIENSLNSTGLACPPTPWKKILTSVPLLAIMCAHIGLNWSFLIFLVEIPTYLKKGLKIDLAKSSCLSALPFLAQWITVSVSGVISDALYNNKILSLGACRKLFNSIGCVGVALGMIALSFLTSEHSGLAVAVVTLSGGILGCCCCGYMLNHIDLSPNFGGIMYALTNFAANLVGIFAPLSAGFILGNHSDDIFRWRIIFCFSACLCLASNVIYTLYSVSDTQEWNEPDTDKIGLELAKTNKTTDNNTEKIEKTYVFDNK